MLRSLQAAIVDLDGTMVDTLGDFEIALNRSLTDLDLPPVTRALVERTVGKGSEHLIRSVLAHQLALPEVKGLANVCDARSAENLYEPAWQRYQHHYLAINGEFAAVYPGVAEGLQQLRDAGLQLACLTNKPLSFAKPLLQAKGLDSFFAHVFGGDSFERKKPDPLPLLKTCEALGVKPTQALMVGDSSNDAQAARAAGCPVVLVRYGYNHGEPVDGVDADAHVDTLTHIAQALACKA
ncbi:phosphoglycolate phosphatase [Limnohabitans sp. TEGF004]|uniref:phosphoglycolate phosphatase n=1 Tax=Limnohabitans sp. TEGF004 TaxID=2986281 RepID=UPI002377B748|nr:phosphoglycolate phosphatase [Limnohabitans sp. TEGF004]BDU56685.1 phosphoglycolate phosphatase, bacterial [Limnohabitans sp. TEGF004]